MSQCALPRHLSLQIIAFIVILVELPDGRVQIVSYHADHENGFIADVRYEGEVNYFSNKILK